MGTFGADAQGSQTWATRHAVSEHNPPNGSTTVEKNVECVEHPGAVMDRTLRNLSVLGPQGRTRTTSAVPAGDFSSSKESPLGLFRTGPAGACHDSLR